MYRTLFSLAGYAIVAWLPLLLLPRWRWTRRLAESAIFPLYLAALYLIGIVGVLAELGPGIMRDFGNVDGVIALLRTESLGLVAWIHILAFDQVVGLLIYRDNMRHRYVPLPVQSLILFLTLMFGPVGFLAYTIARMAHGRSGRIAWGERAEPETSPTPAAEGAPVRFADVAEGNAILPALVGLWRREPVIVACALLAFALAGICAGVAAVRGSWSVPPEGHLLDAMKFEIGVGIYFLTLALLLPFAGMSPRGRRRWVGWTATIAVYFLFIETVQAVRGLDPRFSQAGTTLDQLAGALFGITALITIVLFGILARGFFRRTALPDHPPLRTAVRYGIAAIGFAFGTGIAMSVLRTRIIADTGSLMPMHAAGFHGLQAVPLVALLVGSSAFAPADRMRLTHIAGIGWLVLCAGLLWQAVAGQPFASLSLAGAIAGGGLVLWGACVVAALVVRGRDGLTAGETRRERRDEFEAGEVRRERYGGKGGTNLKRER